MSKTYKVVAYCKECKRPRMIINGLCPGCLTQGYIIFVSAKDFNPLKEMSKK